MSRVAFVKMAGAGNDFILADNRKGLIRGLPQTARKLCDRKHSIGADGLILLERSKSADIRMRILNPDGSEAEMCGNGVRCLARFAVDLKAVKARHTIETLAGLIRADVRGEVVKARMVEPKGLTLGIPLRVGGKKEVLNFIDTGVPHAVKVLSSVASCDVDGSGRVIRFHRYFAPRGTNVNFIALKSGNAIEIRTYERGVEAETLACGTGSVAGALVAASLKGLKSPVRVRTRGGEVLNIYFAKKNGAFTDVYLEGGVEKCFEGRVDL
jgi:diaminopimelate epimerase